MDEKIESGAGPALAAHSKDGSTAGPGPAPSKTGSAAGDGANSASETLSHLSGQARDAAGRAAASASEAVGGASPRLSEHGGRSTDQVAQFVREQPVTALVTTGVVCLALGVLLGRR